ncbi:hypothetical protein [Umezawaea tangerina]|uniref:hypothetical protein n=1 Tax=Umezawaea tangerina TaxID=84725 RepID=UPI000AC3D09C|nr:hypothetical protein [Umezawaea tangerina]
MDNHNEARSGAQVGQQVGAHYGDTAIHYESVYHVNQDDPPERRHEVARNFLEGGLPREAERIFDKLLRAGHVTTERAYLYFLSVVGERSFHDLHGELPGRIIGARKMSASLPPDEWSDAFSVGWRLVRFVRDEAAGGSRSEDLDHVLRSFDSLPQPRQYELSEHMRMILSGVVKERLEASHAVRVVAERLGSGRAARAWKFFEPDPVKPKLYAPPAMSVDQGDKVGLVAGGAALLVGVVMTLAYPTLLGVLLGLPLLAGAGYLLHRHGGVREAVKLRNTVKRREVMPPLHPVVARSPGHWVTTEFVQEVHGLVDGYFTEARPHIAGDWPGYTAGISAHLKQRFVDLYGNSRISAGSIGWLIRWHARQVADGWVDNGLSHNQMAIPPRETRLFRTGLAVGVLGMLVLLLSNGFPPVLFLGVGGFFAGRSAMRARAVRDVVKFLRDDAEHVHKAEVDAYQRWLEVLADRPSDSEMARWLAMDRAYLRDNAISRANLPAHDLVTHVVMTEGARGALRARVVHGPPRFSRYVVQLFLLTHSGVREARVELDFLSGDAWNEQRHLFRYDALASASVTEKGLRATRRGKEVEQLRSRSFQLTLVNGRDITVVAENFRNQYEDDIEDESELFLAALHTSGIDTALPILEAVACEGADWIARDRERSQRWSQGWYE